MIKALNFWGGGRKRIPLFVLCICIAFTSAVAKTFIFDKFGASDGLSWVEAEDDTVGTASYIVYDMGNNDFSMLPETFKNNPKFKPTHCTYKYTDEEGFRVFEDEFGDEIQFKQNELIVVREMLHLLDPTVAYITYYRLRK